MQISRRVTNGLAWCGLLLVVGVPSADIIAARLMGEPERARTAAVPARTVVLEPAERPRLDAPAETVAESEATPQPEPAVAAAPADPVDAFLQSGRPLPAYISGAEPPAATAATPRPVIDTTPAPATPAASPAPASDPIETASIAPAAKVAPIPMPLSMRPRPVEALVIPESVQPPPAIVQPPTAVVQPPSAPPPAYPVVPPQEVAGYGDIVTAEDLADWEFGPLSDFLARRGGGAAQVPSDYDPDGFFLHEGPNGSSATFRRQVVQPPEVVRVYPLYN